jgi:hypothetical protein
VFIPIQAPHHRQETNTKQKETRKQKALSIRICVCERERERESAVCGVILYTLVAFSNSAIFQLYHGKNKLIINEMMMRSALF